MDSVESIVIVIVSSSATTGVILHLFRTVASFKDGATPSRPGSSSITGLSPLPPQAVSTKDNKSADNAPKRLVNVAYEFDVDC